MLVEVVIVVSVGLAVTIFGTFVLAHLTGYYARPPTEKLSDLIKVALAVSGGVGGAVALVVAYRRQRVTEAAHALAKTTATATEYDAAERRITDLYIKAIEQLGSVKAPVRLGGLYGLERLAQGNPAHRQTVIDVICAYLRMPYTPPESDNAQSVRIMVCDGQATTPRGSDASELSAPASTVVAVADPWEEREVRLTAQRMLTQHLSMLDDTLMPDQLAALPPSSERRFWPGLRLNLDRAYLEDFILPLGNIIDGTFAGATFAGRTTSFAGSRITGQVAFDRATFTGSSLFIETRFGMLASFAGVRFIFEAEFNGAKFGAVNFADTRFAGRASFDDATFAVPGVAFGFMKAVFYKGVTGLLENPCFRGWVLQRTSDPPGGTCLVPSDDSSQETPE
jgi:hypothetical protein